MHNEVSVNRRAPPPSAPPMGRVDHHTDSVLPVDMLLRVLDESDHGSIVVDSAAHVLHANRVARQEMDRRDWITQFDGVLVAHDEDATERMHGAVELAQRGHRSLMMLKREAQQLSMVFAPLRHPIEADDPLVLVQLSRMPPSDNLAITLYARHCELSPTEESVMVALCKGLEIPDIALMHRVAESTIRSQIKSIREKTGAHSIRQLLQCLHSLPPVSKAAGN